YTQAGRRDNLYKARIKILVHEIGAEEMRKRVEAEWEAIRHGPLALPQEIIDGIATHFAPPAYATSVADASTTEIRRLTDPQFGLWLRNNIAPHRQPGYAIVNLSL